jgi:hypothetical protein
MNYKQARDFTLQLINQYSVGGVKIADTYNGQADYLKRIPALLNDAAMQAATTTAPIRVIDDLKNLRCDDNGAWLVYTMPEDCWQICSGGLIQYGDEEFRRFHGYHPVGANKIAVPRDLRGEGQVEYFRYPRLLNLAPKDEDELDNTPAVQMALPYYVAAQLVMQDDAFSFSALSNEFESRLARLSQRPHTDLHIVKDSYGW